MQRWVRVGFRRPSPSLTLCSPSLCRRWGAMTTVLVYDGYGPAEKEWNHSFLDCFEDIPNCKRSGRRGRGGQHRDTDQPRKKTCGFGLQACADASSCPVPWARSPSPLVPPPSAAASSASSCPTARPASFVDGETSPRLRSPEPPALPLYWYRFPGAKSKASGLGLAQLKSLQCSIPPFLLLTHLPCSTQGPPTPAD